MSTMIVFVLFLFFCWHCGLALGGCSIDVNRDLYAANQPVLLKKEGANYSLVLPTVKNRQGLVELEKDEELVLACPGKNNYLQEAKKDTIKSKCFLDTSLTIDNGKTFNIRDTKCVLPSTADIRDTRTRCSAIGKIYEIGFEAEGWQPMISVCHNPKEANTLYSKHIIYGASLKGAKHNTERPKFKEGDLKELYDGFDPENFYKKRAQSDLFRSVFGRNKSEIYLDDTKKFLTRGHLAPNADFLFGSWQFATFFFINAAPQWFNINGGNWLEVEKTVRKVAIKMQRNLIVITGTHKILSLENDRGDSKELYLFKNKNSISVPAYFWKLVYDPKTRQAAAFVTSNNPYLKRGSKIPFCADICALKAWTNRNSTVNFTDITEGLTVCCEVRELRAEIPHVPFLDVEGVLTGPY